MRLLGLDVGKATIGVAISDPLGWTAQGLKTLRRRDPASDFKYLLDLIKQYEVEEIVIGLPLNMNGSKGPAAEYTENFAQQLEKISGKKIIYWDERLSTVAAERVLLEGDVSRKKRKKVIDTMAAAYILQGYLDFLGQQND
ncbi:MAG: Holliday junction resolvase RuvX [Bacillota bacterium]|jgi:putative Holliday junction resolvase